MPVTRRISFRSWPSSGEKFRLSRLDDVTTVYSPLVRAIKRAQWPGNLCYTTEYEPPVEQRFEEAPPSFTNPPTTCKTIFPAFLRLLNFSSPPREAKSQTGGKPNKSRTLRVDVTLQKLFSRVNTLGCDDRLKFNSQSAVYFQFYSSLSLSHVYRTCVYIQERAREPFVKVGGASCLQPSFYEKGRSDSAPSVILRTQVLTVRHMGAGEDLVMYEASVNMQSCHICQDRGNCLN